MKDLPPIDAPSTFHNKSPIDPPTEEKSRQSNDSNSMRSSRSVAQRSMTHTQQEQAKPVKLSRESQAPMLAPTRSTTELGNKSQPNDPPGAHAQEFYKPNSDRSRAQLYPNRQPHRANAKDPEAKPNAAAANTHRYSEPRIDYSNKVIAIKNQLVNFDRSDLHHVGGPRSIVLQVKLLSKEGVIWHPATAVTAPAYQVELTMLDGSTMEAFENIHRHTLSQFNTSCHGFSISQGQFWIYRAQVEEWLGNQNLFKQRDDGQHTEGDIVFYRKESTGELLHSAVISSPDNVTMAAGIAMFDGLPTTTVPVEEGWDEPGTALKFGQQRLCFSLY